MNSQTYRIRNNGEFGISKVKTLKNKKLTFIKT